MWTKCLQHQIVPILIITNQLISIKVYVMFLDTKQFQALSNQFNKQIEKHRSLQVKLMEYLMYLEENKQGPLNEKHTHPLKIMDQQT